MKEKFAAGSALPDKTDFSYSFNERGCTEGAFPTLHIPKESLNYPTHVQEVGAKTEYQRTKTLYTLAIIFPFLIVCAFPRWSGMS